MVLPQSLEATKLRVDVHPYHYTQRFPGPDGNDVTERWEKAKKPFGKGGYGTVWRVYELAGPRRIRAVKIVAKANVALRELEGLVALNDVGIHFSLPLPSLRRLDQRLMGFSMRATSRTSTGGGRTR